MHGNSTLSSVVLGAKRPGSCSQKAGKSVRGRASARIIVGEGTPQSYHLRRPGDGVRLLDFACYARRRLLISGLSVRVRRGSPRLLVGRGMILSPYLLRPAGDIRAMGAIRSQRTTLLRYADLTLATLGCRTYAAQLPPDALYDKLRSCCRFAILRHIARLWFDPVALRSVCRSFHHIFGRETPACRRGEEWPSPFFCGIIPLSRGVTASVVPNAGNSERQRPQGRGDSGCLWYVDGLDSPTLVVSQPPDANRVGRERHVATPDGVAARCSADASP